MAGDNDEKSNKRSHSEAVDNGSGKLIQSIRLSR